MAQVEELFVIDPDGGFNPIEECTEFGYETGEISIESTGNNRKVSDDGTKTISCKNDVKSDGEIRDGDCEDQCDHSSYENSFKNETDDMDFDHSEFKLANIEHFEWIRNLQDDKLESMTCLGLWNLYKEIGPNIWPSFLRYENPPKHVKISEYRFYFSEKSGKVDQEVVFASIKDGPNMHEKEISLQENYLLYINEMLKDLHERKGFYSYIFNSVENARNGLINLYLITNGIRKGVSIARCQFCGSSNCDRKAKTCKANRCFKCLLKGHQIKECDTKYGFFNQKLLLPIRMEREHIFTGRNLIEKLFNPSSKSSNVTISNSELCVCFNCNQVGHINCSNLAPMISKGSNIKDIIALSEGRFLIFQKESDSPVQNSKIQYFKTNITISSNKLFNISYLLEFTGITRDKTANTKQNKPRNTASNSSTSQETRTRFYPQDHVQFHHPNQFNLHSHNVLMQQQVPANYPSQIQGIQSLPQSLHQTQTQNHAFYQNYTHRYQIHPHGQLYNHNRYFSNHINAEFSSIQGGIIAYPRNESRMNTVKNSSGVKRKRFNNGFRSRKR